MPGDHGEETAEERRLRELNEELYKFDPDDVKRAFLESGALEVAFAAIKNIAFSSNDPLAREDARREIEARGLGFLLAPETDESE